MMMARAPFDTIQAGKYGALLIDPPWHFKSYTALQVANPGSRRDVERHYQTMSFDEISALPIREIAAKDCHLFLWVTGPCLPQGFKLIDAWGFRYSSVAFTWVKLKRKHDPLQFRFLPTADSDLHVGLGLTTRKNTEFCLLARRGSPRRNARDVREVILSPVREHSRKPDDASARIERYCDGPYIELFARERRPGWSSWGHETEMFGSAAA